MDTKTNNPTESKQKIELSVGKTYYIDKKFANGGTVELIKIYGKYFCRVRCTETKA